ncbi:MAG: type I restriction-modification system subunit M N-terminal domain-containing protein [Woeseia sp.]
MAQRLMTHSEQQKLVKLLWNIADQLRGMMNADDFHDYVVAFPFLRCLSDDDAAALPRAGGLLTS